MKKAFAVQSFTVHMRDEKFRGLAKELQKPFRSVSSY